MSAQFRNYLGDGVYAEFDGYQIWLSTLEGSRIALDNATFNSLIDFHKKIDFPTQRVERLNQPRAAAEEQR